MRVWLAGMLVLAALSGCNRLEMHAQESYVFGTRVEVQVWGEPEDKARAAVGDVLREFDRLNHAYHAWQPSELTTLNEAIAAGRSLEVSPELAGLVRDAQAMAAQGDYLFDPGIGRLIEAWGFHNDEFVARLPDPAKVADFLAARPSIRDLRVDGRRVSSRNKAVALDFGGFLKGWALDRAAGILKAHGIRNALINIGGNVMALGSKNGTPWRVGIQAPRSTLPLATLDLLDGEAIGTSGDYQRYFELNGRRYCHLLDPRSGEPAQGTQAVTLLIPPGPRAGTLSDGPSKPLFIAGEAWQAQAKKQGLTQVLRVGADGRVQITAPLKDRLHFESPETRVEVLP